MMCSVHVGELLEARFVERVNRFLCKVVVNKEVIEVHLHDPGRLKELLIPHCEVLLKEVHSLSRKTAYDLVGIYYEDSDSDKVLVCCDSRIPNVLVGKALREKALPDFHYSVITPEYKYNNSRIDFCLDDKILLEVKGVTLVRNGKALFPDAPTKRGTKHLKILISALERGFKSYIFFLIQRPDAFSFSPNGETDPEFAHTLAQAVERGVIPLVYTSEFNGTSVQLGEKIFIEM